MRRAPVQGGSPSGGASVRPADRSWRQSRPVRRIAPVRLLAQERPEASLNRAQGRLLLPAHAGLPDRDVPAASSDRPPVVGLLPDSVPPHARSARRVPPPVVDATG